MTVAELIPLLRKPWEMDPPHSHMGESLVTEEHLYMAEKTFQWCKICERWYVYYDEG